MIKKKNCNKVKKLLILGSTINQLPFIMVAQKKKIFTISLDNVPENICHKYADENVNISTIDKNLVLEYARDNNVDGVVTCASDLALPTVTYVCNKLNLPSVSNDAVNKTINKDIFRNFLSENKFKLPKYFIFSSEEETFNKIKQLKNKWIIKPVDSSGSKGISLLDFDIKNKNYKKLIINAFSFSRVKKIIIEEYISGNNCSIDGFINNGVIDFICITNKTLTPLPYLTPISHTIPSELPLSIQKKIKQNIIKILEILKIKTSPFDFDIITTRKGEVYILEMSLRIGGNGIPRLMFYNNGYDIYESVALCALGNKIDKKFILNKKLYTGVFLIYGLKTGILQSISSKESILKKYSRYIKEIVYDVDVGDKVENFTQGNHRLGHFILQTKTKELLKKISKKIKLDLKIIIVSE